MSTITAEDRAAMTESVRRLLANQNTEADVRRTMETPQGYDDALWAKLVELGVTGLTIPTDYDGLGGGPVELERIMEEAGAALLSAPLFSGAMAAALIEASGDTAAMQRLLPGIAGGRTATVAFTGDAGTWTEDGVGVSAHAHGNHWALDGVASYVQHGANADLIIVVAKTHDGFALFEVSQGAEGLTAEVLPTFDHTQRLAKLSFAHVDATKLGTAGWEAVERMRDVALVGLAGEQAGGARRVLEFTTQYAKQRIQFGRAIGSFQAIKHMAADLLMESESAISAARAAAAALAENAADKDAAVALAAFACADAFSKVTADAVQMHGGIAFTWAHPAHLYLRRARADAQLFGAASMYRERYLKALGA
ncbi:MAG: acyl-CoA/acyl-ACP dehydrogenase [Alphaproteobacteria bacterium]|nr:acyl-CoA/acyl-ACP dehydrogenase [Alphaproteobacteria bacterium]